MLTAHAQQVTPLTNDNIKSAVRLWLDTDNNDQSAVEDLYGGPIGDWDTSGITDLTEVFADVQRGSLTSSSDTSNTSTPTSLAGWDTSRVTSLRACFYNTTNFAAQGTNEWDVSAVVDMRVLLAYATDFGSDVSTWNTASLQTLTAAFADYSTTTPPVAPTEETLPIISSWKTPSLTDMEGVFASTQFFQTNLEGWSTSKVTNMAFMLEDSVNFYGGDLSALDVSSVTSMEHMFASATNVRGTLNIASGWDTLSVTNMDRIFHTTTVTYGDPNQPVPTDAYLFYLCWDLDGLTNISGLDEAFCFSNAGGFNCDCVREDMVDRINTGCNTTRKTCFNSLSSVGDLGDNNDTTNNNPNMVDTTLANSGAAAVSPRRSALSYCLAAFALVASPWW